MKKLFISVPMKGRTEENIKKSMDKMHKIAEIIFDQPLERIESYIPDNAPGDCRDKRIWFLGESIKLMSEADYFIGVEEYFGLFQGCAVERNVAQLYQVCTYFIDLGITCPDIDIDEMIKRDVVA